MKRNTAFGRWIALLLAVIMVMALTACGSSSKTEPAETEAPESAPAEETAAAEEEAPESAPAEETETAEEEAPESAPAEEAETAEADAAESAGKKVLRIGTIETAQSYSLIDEGSLPMYLSYEYLVKSDRNGDTIPWLAEEVVWVDELTMRIKLRDGIYFANGEQMIGEDVLYSMYYVAYTPGSILSDKFTLVDYDASYVEDDNLTVIVKVKEPYYVLSTWLVKLGITDKSTVENRASNDPDWWDKPVSSSAYEIVENVDGSHVTFRLRDDYWDKEHMPQWDEIIFNYFSNATAMFIAYENGELDLVLKADYKDYDRALAGDIAKADSTSCYAVTVNGPQQFILGAYCEYFKDPKVREAFTHALDTDAIGMVAYGSLYHAGLESIVSPQFEGAYEAQGLNVYDPELARQCMAESNYPDGFDIKCIAMDSDGPALEVVKENLAAIGVNLNVETYDFATMLANVLTPGSTDVGFWGGTLHSVDVYEAISPFYDSEAITTSRILDPEFNALYYSIPGIADKDELNEVVKEMQRWIYKNMWIIPVCEVSYAIIYDNTVLQCNLPNLAVSFIQYECVPVE